MGLLRGSLAPLVHSADVQQITYCAPGTVLPLGSLNSSWRHKESKRG